MNTLANRRFRTYLRAVKRNTRHMPKADQRELVHSLEEQFHEAVGRNGGTEIGESAIRSIIESMADPKEFAPDDAERDGAADRFGPMALWTAFAAVGIVILGVTLDIALPNLSNLGGATLFIGFILILISLALGIVGRRHPSGVAAIIISILFIFFVTLLVPVRVDGGQEETYTQMEGDG